MSIPFDDFFEGELEAKVEDALAQAREHSVRLEAVLRSQRPGQPSKDEDKKRWDNTTRAERVAGDLKLLAEASPGASFEGELRVNFRAAGDSKLTFGSFTRTIGRSGGGTTSASNDEINRFLFDAARFGLSSALRSAEVNNGMMEAASKYMQAVTPKMPEGDSLLERMVVGTAPHLLGRLIAPASPARAAAPAPTAQGPTPATNATPQIAPSADAPELTAQAQELTADQVKEWLKAHPELAQKTVMQALAELPPDQQARLMSGA